MKIIEITDYELQTLKNILARALLTTHGIKNVEHALAPTEQFTVERIYEKLN